MERGCIGTFEGSNSIESNPLKLKVESQKVKNGHEKRNYIYLFLRGTKLSMQLQFAGPWIMEEGTILSQQ